MRDYAPAPVFDGTAVRYYPNGESMFADMLPALESAEHSIYVESFIIGMGEMWGRIHEILRRKAREGLDVRLIYDDAGCLSLLPHNYDEILRAEGIRAFSFNPFVPLLNLVMNNRDHRKIMVVDGAVAFTGGINMADEYINQRVRFGHWKDSGVRLEGPAARSLANIFLTFWKARYPKGSPGPGSRPPPQVPPRPTDAWCSLCGQPRGPGIGGQKCLSGTDRSGPETAVPICTPLPDPGQRPAHRPAAGRQAGGGCAHLHPGVPDKPTIYLLTRSYFRSLLRGVKIYRYVPGSSMPRPGCATTVSPLWAPSTWTTAACTCTLSAAPCCTAGRCWRRSADFASIEAESELVRLEDCRTGFLGTLHSSFCGCWRPCAETRIGFRDCFCSPFFLMPGTDILCKISIDNR